MEFQRIVARIAPHMRKQDMRLAFDTMKPAFKLVSKLAFFKRIGLNVNKIEQV